MEKQGIIEILTDWNFWKEDLETGIRRPDYLARLKGLLDARQVVVITGPRRAGKSYLMRQWAKDLIETGLPRGEILFINFEDPRWPELDKEFLQKIYETYLEFLSPRGKPVVFLDEVQEVLGWEKWVRMMHELGKARIILSGSNAKLLGKELATALTGRHVDATVFPLSLKEHLLFKGIIFKDELDWHRRRIEIASTLREIFEFGSFPHVVLSGEKKQILLNYFEDLLNRDLIRRFKIRKADPLKGLARYYFTNTASTVTFNAVERFLNISADTAERFSRFFEEAYLFSFVKRFSFKVKEQEKSPRKVYPVDTGLARTIGFRIGENWGRLAETLVFQELARKRSRDPGCEVFYWKDPQHREVDFVLRENREVRRLIQVCWDTDRPETREREVRALLKALEEFRLKEGWVVTEDREEEETINGRTIRYIPLWKWLLSEP